MRPADLSGPIRASSVTLLDGGNELALAQNTLSRVRLADDDFVGGFEEDE